MSMVKIFKKIVFIPFKNFFLKILVPIVTETRLGCPRLVIGTRLGCPRLVIDSRLGCPRLVIETRSGAVTCH